MSKVHICLIKVDDFETSSGHYVALENSDNWGTGETLTSSGSNQVSTLSLTAFGSGDSPGRYAWCVTNMGVDPIYGTSGAGTPVATAGVSKAIMPYQTRFIRCKAFGDKFAIINVT